jgi:hypothetical protein
LEEYRQRTGDHDAGVLIPSLSGVHSRFFQNSFEKPVTVRLRLSGFYELVPPGEYGKGAKILTLLNIIALRDLTDTHHSIPT